MLKLHRQYGKNESFKILFDEISSLRFQIGELKSLVAELTDTNQSLHNQLSAKEKIKKSPEWQKDEYIKELKATLAGSEKRNGIVNLMFNQFLNTKKYTL